jgi:hypothetical protein
MLPYKGLKDYICKKYNNIKKIIIEEKKRTSLHIIFQNVIKVAKICGIILRNPITTQNEG